MKPKHFLWLELCTTFGTLPLLVMAIRERGFMAILLWLMALCCYRILAQDTAFRFRAEWNWGAVKGGMKDILPRFFLLIPLLLLFTWLYVPDKLFSFPLERPYVWLMVMLLYPLLSVVPQELIYRSYFFHRFAPIFTTPTQYALASAVMFGYVHIIFMNWVALVFTGVGGWLFAQTYLRHRSLALVCVEHALYGCLIFTLGLGWYFYGAAWRH